MGALPVRRPLCLLRQPLALLRPPRFVLAPLLQTQHKRTLTFSHTDLNRDSWLHRTLPRKVVPFAELARLDRPIGTYLLLYPSLWSISLAAEPGVLPDLYTCALFATGAVLMRGAGCTVNDLWDRDIDKLVERTRNRPLASGAVTVPSALAFLGAQLSLALGVLLQLPPQSIVLGLASTPLWALYPLAKRVTDWPQAVLGCAINWGALLGWVSVRGEADFSVILPLYFGSFMWTLHYDTIYAHQDRRDDRKIGVRSTAVRLGEGTTRFLIVSSTVCVGSLAIAGHAADVSPAYFLGLSGAAAHLGWQVRSANLADPADCLRIFASNRDFGAIVLASIILGKLLSAKHRSEDH